MPSYETFSARVEALKHLNFERPKRVSVGYPDRIIESWVWNGADFTGERTDGFVISLSEDDVLEIETALANFKQKRKGQEIDHGEVLT